MSETPWLSVVIPVYRAEAHIADTIESVTSQGVPGVEIICVDDCSPDNSAGIIADIARGNTAVTVLTNEDNKGPGASRNAGIDAARGDYIVFLDADDSLAEGSLSALRDTVVQTPSDLVLVGCDEIRRGKTRSLTSGPLWDWLTTMSAPTAVASEPRVLLWPPAPWSKVYRREFLNTHHLRFGDGVAQDIPWSAAVTLRAERITACGGSFYRYLTAHRDSSITTTKSEKNLIRLAQVTAIREGIDPSAHSIPVLQHLSALATIHLIWSNRAAYRLLPDSRHEEFFHHSAAELGQWNTIVHLPRWLDSRPLMSAFDRNIFGGALLGGDWERWQKTLARHKTFSRFRRIVRPGQRTKSVGG
jgi:glycosyltransferase involved in cell wall biosynthesis